MSSSQTLARIVPIESTSGMLAVSPLEASAIARSKPAIFWKRLITRSTNAGRSQNVSVRKTRPRSAHARESLGAVPGRAILPALNLERGAPLGSPERRFAVARDALELLLGRRGRRCRVVALEHRVDVGQERVAAVLDHLRVGLCRLRVG